MNPIPVIGDYVITHDMTRIYCITNIRKTRKSTNTDPYPLNSDIPDEVSLTPVCKFGHSYRGTYKYCTSLKKYTVLNMANIANAMYYVKNFLNVLQQASVEYNKNHPEQKVK
jgi:hypothetical protein